MLPTAMNPMGSAASPVGGPSSMSIANHKDFPAGPNSSIVIAVPKIRTVGHDFSEADYAMEDQRFFVPIDRIEDGVTAALLKLNEELLKDPVTWIGREVSPGELGLINHGGFPKILTRPGRYPRFPLRNWWGREWCGTQPLSNAIIEFKGLTVVQISQNQNRISVVKSSFVAHAVGGTYNVLAIVNQTHLQSEVKDPATGGILGWQAVKMRSHVGAGTDQEYVVALLFVPPPSTDPFISLIQSPCSLNIPANNCAILQRGNDLKLLPSGQHHITNPNVTLRGLYSLGVNRLEIPIKEMQYSFTKDQIPVELRIYLKWSDLLIFMRSELTILGYSTPYDALRDKAQSILMNIAAHLSYSSMMKQSSLGPDNVDDGTHPASIFRDTLRGRAMDEMHNAASECGIDLMDFAIVNRQFRGDIATKINRLATKALQAQAEAANVEIENSMKVQQEEGTLSVARIKAQASNPDSEAYGVIAAAKARAEAIRLTAEAEAHAIRIKAAADADVVDQFAREIGMRRVEVSRVQACTNRTTFVPSDGPGSQMGGTMVMSMLGSEVRR
ncbi:hypothetical protein JVU11DRAFT_3744 [Chiua virens]|nr:hypothetical protein JVU11DRAFT_3744 [Chiua virens]